MRYSAIISLAVVINVLAPIAQASEGAGERKCRLNRCLKDLLYISRNFDQAMKNIDDDQDIAADEKREDLESERQYFESSVSRLQKFHRCTADECNVELAKASPAAK